MLACFIFFLREREREREREKENKKDNRKFTEDDNYNQTE